MGEGRARRVWDAVSTAPAGDGFGIFLDGKPVYTPAKSQLILPTGLLAVEIAKEWSAQKTTVDPASMPLTRTANSAIDKVAPQKAGVAGLLADYGDCDLVCYRAEAPETLVARQAAAWNPVIDWAAASLGARLVPQKGIIHVPQPEAATTQLSGQVHALTNFELAGFHDLVSLSGSLLLAFATVHNFAGVGEIWQLSRIDENWQAELWGVDQEAEVADEKKQSSFFDAEKFMRLSRKKV